MMLILIKTTVCVSLLYGFTILAYGIIPLCLPLIIYNMCWARIQLFFGQFYKLYDIQVCILIFYIYYVFFSNLNKSWTLYYMEKKVWT